MSMRRLCDYTEQCVGVGRFLVTYGHPEDRSMDVCGDHVGMAVIVGLDNIGAERIHVSLHAPEDL